MQNQSCNQEVNKISNVTKYFALSDELSNLLSEMSIEDIKFIIYEVLSLKSNLQSILNACSVYDESYDSIITE